MNPMHMDEWKKLYPADVKPGISLHFSNVHPFVRDWLMVYTRWLRSEFMFPVHVNVYCVFGYKIRCYDHSRAFGRFVEPFDRKKHPFIYLAGGEFQKDDEVNEYMRSETTMIMVTYSHELIHYYQYINGVEMKIRSLEWQATYYGNRLLRYFDSLYEDGDDVEDE